MEYILKPVLMAYIAELGEEDPATKYSMLQLYREIDSGRFDAKNIKREREELMEEILKVKDAIAVWEAFMGKMDVKRNV